MDSTEVKGQQEPRESSDATSRTSELEGKNSGALWHAANKWWDLANVIAGFAVVQGLSFILTFLGTDLSCRLFQLRSAHYFFLPVTVAFGLLYVWALWKCFDKEAGLNPNSALLNARKAALRIRIAAVVAIGVLVLLTAAEVWLPDVQFDKIPDSWSLAYVCKQERSGEPTFSM